VWAGAKNLVSSLLLLENVIWVGSNPLVFGVMWTLPPEVDMYFLLPFLFFSYTPQFRSLAAARAMSRSSSG
jgi:peptidoglycan/LPS O-acetylase OafA/YrhL